MENRTIWLISKNDGQLYGLDFEPDQKKADEIEARARMEFDRRCAIPDLERIKLIKEAQEKFKKQ